MAARPRSSKVAPLTRLQALQLACNARYTPLGHAVKKYLCSRHPKDSTCMHASMPRIACRSARAWVGTASGGMPGHVRSDQ
eukprot:363841-Chlamydomonas_euryale.AAC.7